MSDRDAVDRLPMVLRTFVQPKGSAKPGKPRGARRAGRHLPPSKYTLIFDVETTTDAAQHRRLVVYQLRKDDDLVESGLGYEESELTDDEVAVVRGYCELRCLRCMSFTSFVNDIFRRYAFHLGALVVLFNQEFDLSRLVDRQPAMARGHFSGGFSFLFSDDPRDERLRTKHLNRTTSLVAFTARAEQRVGRSGRKHGRAVPPRRGHFVDVATLARALTGRGWALEGLANHLKTTTRKGTTDLDGPVTDGYLNYACDDVQVTWECFLKLRDQYTSMQLHGTPVTRILSEASIAKATLREMGIIPGAAATSLDEADKARLMSTYYGGRAEVNIRRQRVEVLYCDVTSAYPAGGVLMGLWRYMVATGIEQSDVTDRVQRLLARLTIEAVLDPVFWWDELHTLVRVAADDDLFPLRAPYEAAEAVDDEAAPTIGLNHVITEEPRWWTLADCVASTLRTGRPPTVVEAIRFRPVGVQEGLRSIDLFGDPAFHLDPSDGDAFRLLVEMRSRTKHEAAAQEADGDLDASDVLEGRGAMLKAVVCSAAYGIGAEVQVTHRSTPVTVTCHGDGSTRFDTSSRAVETTGEFFNPIFATFATAGARLFLALAEQLAAEACIDWAYCDTDSMTFVRPDGWDREAFLNAVNAIRGRMQALYPFGDGGDLLKMERANYSLDDPGVMEPLYCYAVAPKRYALFNLVDDKPVIRDASAHGLGHLMAPYGSTEGQPLHPTIPAPVMDCAKAGISRWHHDLWYRIIESDLAGHPDRVDLGDFPNIDAPAASQYRVSGPRQLSWFDAYNSSRGYPDQVKAHNFLTVFQSRGRHAVDKVRPIAPFDRDVRRAASRVFDRLTGSLVSTDQLKTYREVLSQYHLQSEWKFRGAESIDRGRVVRRHVLVDGVHFIGKEADRWEERLHLGDDDGHAVVYPGPAVDANLEDLLEQIRGLGIRGVAAESGVSVAMVSMVVNGKRKPGRVYLARMRRAVSVLLASGSVTAGRPSRPFARVPSNARSADSSPLKQRKGPK